MLRVAGGTGTHFGEEGAVRQCVRDCESQFGRVEYKPRGMVKAWLLRSREVVGGNYSL